MKRRVNKSLLDDPLGTDIDEKRDIEDGDLKLQKPLKIQDRLQICKYLPHSLTYIITIILHYESKLFHNNIHVVLLQLYTIHRDLMLLGSVACITGGSIFYQNTLEGGTIEWIHAHMDYFVKNMIMSVLMYFTGLLLLVLVRKNMHPYMWSVMMIIVLLVLGVVLSRDMGATLENHGMFNLLMLFVMMIPVLLYASMWLLAFRLFGKKRGTILHVTIIAVVLFSIIYSKYEAQRMWPRGLFGKSLEFDSHGIKIPTTDFLPWEAVQPSGWNVILGQSCPHQHEFATLSDGLLAIDCHPDKLPYFIEYPDFISSREGNTSELQEISDWKQSERRTIPYSLPVYTTAETIQAFCGDEQIVLIQASEDQKVLERVTKPQHESETTSHPNVLILFIDTLSRAHFFRKLPKTAKVMAEKHKNGNSSVFQFFKYNAIAPHTGPNTVPMFLGTPDTGGVNLSFDQHPFWWEHFDKKNYVSAWSAGFCESWSKTYLKIPFPPGFLDHMMISPFCHPDAFPLHNPHGPIDGPYSSRRRCVGSRKVHTYLLQYAKELLSIYPTAGKLGTITFMEGHEGSLEVVSQLDGDLAEFLDNGLGDQLKNTFIFIVSDHGNHMSPYFLWTTSGKLENKLPAFFLMAPGWFKTKYPTLAESMLGNENKLVTAYDIYNTLVELHKLPEFNSDASEDSLSSLKGLFSDLPDRTCPEAKVPEWMCAFVNSTSSTANL